MINAFKHVRECPAYSDLRPAQCVCTHGVARRFKVYVYNHGLVDVIATTRDKAKFAVFAAMKDADYVHDMAEFFAQESPRVKAVGWGAPYEMDAGQ